MRPNSPPHSTSVSFNIPRAFREVIGAVKVRTEADVIDAGHLHDAAVRREGAELGIAFDGDADRIGDRDRTGDQGHRCTGRREPFGGVFDRVLGQLLDYFF